SVSIAPVLEIAWRDLISLIHFFSLLSGGHSSLEPRLPIPNRIVKRVCADDSVPFAHAKVGYRHDIFKRKPRVRKSAGVFVFCPDRALPAWAVYFEAELTSVRHVIRSLDGEHEPL